MPDRIHLTVAAVVPRDHQYLMVREISEGQEVYNQPAGHVEPGESPIDAVIRETLEETGWRVKPTGVLSFTTYTSERNGVTYYRLAIIAEPIIHDDSMALDDDIEEALWLSYDEIQSLETQIRSPMVLQAIDSYRAGRIHPLDLLMDLRKAGR